MLVGGGGILLNPAGPGVSLTRVPAMFLRAVITRDKFNTRYQDVANPN